MSYVISVGGDPINPNPYYYSQISLTTSQTLIWPSTGQSSTYVATNWIDVTANSTGYILTCPPANEAGTGAEIVFNNYGSNSIIINNSASGNITTVGAGNAIRIWITDNSTAAGTWRVANIGAGTTTAVASMFAGAGLIAQAGLLSQSMPVASFNADATINLGYRAYLVKWTGGSGTFTLDSAITSGSNWFVAIKNAGTGTLTINGGGTNIDGTSTVTASVNEGFTITSDGAVYSTTGRITPNTSGYTYLSKSVTGSTDIILSASEAVYNIINYTGTLGKSINVVTPSAVNQWIMSNASTGSGYTLTIKTASGSGEVLSQTDTRELYCDGTNVLLSDGTTSGVGTVTSVGTGTGLSGGPINISGTISISNTGVVAGTYGTVAKIPQYTVNAQGQFTSSTDMPVSITDANLSAVIGVAKGGTGLATLTANNVILGNGASNVQFVSPSTSGNLLTSNGTTWNSTAPAVPIMTALGVGSIITATQATGISITAGETTAASNLTAAHIGGGATGDSLSGTYQALQTTGSSNAVINLYQRTV